MEKIWNKATLNDYQKCFDILNTQPHMENETFKNFAIELFEIAKKQLNSPDCKLKFVNDEKNNLGFASSMDNTVTLNLRKMDKNTLFKTVSTIYHELTHIHQDKTNDKKRIGTSKPAKFPFERCYGDERFMPPEILGISPFLFYYTSQKEKQARDVGSECAMELFNSLNNITKTQPSQNSTKRLIDRCINQVQLRWDRENLDNVRATTQINSFLSQNPNFIYDAFDKIKQEFINDTKNCSPMSNERFAYENRFNCRIGSLVLLGCDDNLKNQIYEFISSNFVSKGEVFNTFISVIDSPYSTTTKEELSMLLKLAELNNCPKDTLINFLISWDKQHLNEVFNSLSFNDKKQNKSFSGNEFGL
ncbi:MAG: hypothetical protein IJX17_02230 [Clostridia bacterium]|nr:hypothetical protein [Clostridia bacterium]